VADSPNRSLAEPRALLFQFTGDRSVPALLNVVAEAVRGKQSVRTQPGPVTQEPAAAATC
jgi:hypothetical protein